MPWGWDEVTQSKQKTTNTLRPSLLSNQPISISFSHSRTQGFNPVITNPYLACRRPATFPCCETTHSPCSAAGGGPTELASKTELRVSAIWRNRVFVGRGPKELVQSTAQWWRRPRTGPPISISQMSDTFHCQGLENLGKSYLHISESVIDSMSFLYIRCNMFSPFDIIYHSC